jgi:hypothetical protein
MFGIVLATVNALAAAAPSVVSSSTCLRKPVIRLTRVAIAIEPVDAISREFELGLSFPPSCSAVGSGAGGASGEAVGAGRRAGSLGR